MTIENPFYSSFCSIYTEAKQFEELMNLLKSCGDFFAQIPKAKTAKIVRSMLELVGSLKDLDSLDIQISLCKDVIEWCKVEKRTFLRQRVESRLAVLFLAKKNPQEAQNIIMSLLKELKKLGTVLHLFCSFFLNIFVFIAFV